MKTVLRVLVLLALTKVASAQTCTATKPLSNPSTGAHWNGWGAGITNARFQTAEQAGITAADVPRLKLKWAFGIAGVTQARSQVAVAGGRIFFGSDPAGVVYSLDAKTGCTYWSYKARSEERRVGKEC